PSPSSPLSLHAALPIYPRSRRSLRENLGRFLASDDRPSERRFPRPLSLHSSASSDFVWNKAAGFPFHVLSLGRHGSIHPQSRFADRKSTRLNSSHVKIS